MRGHADAATLAAFHEHILPRHQAREVAAHLAQCAQCTRLDTQLAGLPAILASTPVPPMPATLTARIEAALAAEAAARPAEARLSGQTDGLAAVGAHSDGPLSPPAGRTTPPADPKHPASRAGGLAARRRARTAGRPRLALTLAAAAAAIVVIAGGGYGLTQLLTSSTGPTSFSSASGGTAAAPATRGQGIHAGPNHAASGAAGDAAFGLVLHSGTNYQPAELRRQVAAAMGRYATVRPAPSSTAKRSALPSALSPHLPGCLANVLAGHRPLLVDEARYQGQPAVVIVLPSTSGTRVLVEAAACTAAGKARQLASTTLAR